MIAARGRAAGSATGVFPGLRAGSTFCLEHGSADAPCADVDEPYRSVHHGSVCFRAVHRERSSMNLLHWALVFLVVALIAALFGFVGIVAAAVEIAKILFGIFLVIFLLLLVLHLFHGGRSRVP